MVVKPTSYVHLPGISGYGGICLAYEPTSDRYASGTTRVYKVTTSLCNDVDRYTKKIGRLQVDANMAAGQYALVKIPKYNANRPREYFAELAEFLVN
jgi:hypothetical protein